MAPLILFSIGCHNSNPEQGSGGIKAEKHTILSSSGIVDSTKSILDRSIALKKKYEEGKIDDMEFKKINTELMATYFTLYNSLSPADTLIISQYRIQKEKEILKDTLKSQNAPRWE